PDELIHHFNLIDPDHRELFLPISRRLLAAGRETGPVRLPGLLFGLPLKRGEHVVASGMVENLTSATYRQARVRLVMDFTPAGRLDWARRPYHPGPQVPGQRLLRQSDRPIDSGWRDGGRGWPVRARSRRRVARGGSDGLTLSAGLPALHAARGRARDAAAHANADVGARGHARARRGARAP